MSVHTTSPKEQVIESLSDKEYRDLYVEEHISQGLAFQIRAMREDREWTQSELASRTKKVQETISQLENPDYGRYTLHTLQRLASAFDVALSVQFVPFSELVDWTTNLTLRRLAPPSFDEEFEEGS